MQALSPCRTLCGSQPKHSWSAKCQNRDLASAYFGSGDNGRMAGDVGALCTLLRISWPAALRGPRGPEGVSSEDRPVGVVKSNTSSGSSSMNSRGSGPVGSAPQTSPRRPPPWRRSRWLRRCACPAPGRRSSVWKAASCLLFEPPRTASMLWAPRERPASGAAAAAACCSFQNCDNSRPSAFGAWEPPGGAIGVCGGVRGSSAACKVSLGADGSLRDAEGSDKTICPVTV
mmetsp:Transcript_48737/g.128784  ORF Transcript_48737/g.128784 Transcript_48737/m.128784 type:complete len:230 (+) Transcript_48737:209-898(+)